MDWQWIIVIACVGAAAAFLARSMWVAWKAPRCRDECSTCSSAHGPGCDRPEQRLVTIRRRPPQACEAAPRRQ
jgi:hypothetical protein